MGVWRVTYRRRKLALRCQHCGGKVFQIVVVQSQILILCTPSAAKAYRLPAIKWGGSCK